MKKFSEIQDQRHNAILALGESVNLYLEIQFLSITGNKELAEYIDKIREKLPECYSNSNGTNPYNSFFLCQTFISLISEFEGYLVDIMKNILLMYPRKIGTEEFSLTEIIELGDIDNIVTIAAERYLNKIMYKRANEYKKELLEILSTNKEFLKDNWNEYVELKARRDIGIHNDWIINDTYIRKAGEVGIKVETSGFYPISNIDFWDALRTISSMMTEITIHCDKKFIIQR